MTFRDRVRAAGFRTMRKMLALRRPSARENMQALRARQETLQGIILRNAVPGDIPALAELHVDKLFVLRDYQRLGLGRRLVGQVVEKFLSGGVSAMAAYVDPRNPSCGFFERLGGKWLIEPDGHVNFSWYVWNDLPGLARYCSSAA